MSDIKFSTNDGRNFKPNMSNKKIGFITIICIITIAVLIVLFNCFTIVNEGYIGVKYQLGRILTSDLTAGLNFHLPFIEEIQQVDTRNQVYSVEVEAYTSDTQTVRKLNLKLNYYYDQSKLSEIIRNVGISNVETKLLVPNVAKTTKNEIGKVKAEVLVQSRSEVQSAIQAELTEVLSPEGIIVSAFALENLNFDEAFEASIQAKVIAAQDALKMENKTREREEEGKQVVIAAQADADSVEIAAAAEAKAVAIMAEAEAKAIELIALQLANNPNYIDYLKITNWNGILPQVVSDGVNPFLVLDGTETDKNTNNAYAPAGYYETE